MVLFKSPPEKEFCSVAVLPSNNQFFSDEDIFSSKVNAHRYINKSCKLLLECFYSCDLDLIKKSEQDGHLTAVYACIDGNFFDTEREVKGLGDFGPIEYLQSFHSLTIYHAINFFKITGPITTFGDPQFGFYQALDQAVCDMQDLGIKTAVFAGVSLGSSGEGAGVIITTSLKKLLKLRNSTLATKIKNRSFESILDTTRNS